MILYKDSYLKQNNQTIAEKLSYLASEELYQKNKLSSCEDCYYNPQCKICETCLNHCSCKSVLIMRDY